MSPEKFRLIRAIMASAPPNSHDDAPAEYETETPTDAPIPDADRVGTDPRRDGSSP